MSADTIHALYGALAERDGEAMAGCYGDRAVFSDPVFGRLDADEVRAMWRMLCRNATDLRVEHRVLDASDTEGRASWTAEYTFSSTGRSVTNHVTGEFRFDDGLIVSHHDSFSFWKWSAQALGVGGALLGWSPMLRSKVRSTARRDLDAFREAR